MKKTKKIIIAGGRDFSDYEKLKGTCERVIDYSWSIEIVSGCCDTGVHTFTRPDGTKVYGADGLGERYASESGFDVKLFPADWKTFGASAGPIRNQEMANYGNQLISFWNGKSKGTLNMIHKARGKSLKVDVISY